MRYEVTSVSGFLSSQRGKAKPGVSFHVVDTLWNHRLMGTWRSEDYHRSHFGARTRAQSDAEACAERLNSGVALAPAAPSERSGAFRPNCPRCSNVCAWHALYCDECGTRLYPAWSGKYDDR